MTTSTNPAFLQWLAEVNEILYANGSTQIIDSTDAAIQFDYDKGWNPHQAASDFLGVTITQPAPPAPTKADLLAALIHARKLIKFWYNMANKEDDEKWRFYDRNTPDMDLINNAILAAKP